MCAATTITPPVEVTREFIDMIVERAGFVHPLFNPTAEQRTSGQFAPLPGQGVLVLAGGLAEQSGVLDHAIAMVEMRSVRFLKMATAGSSLRLELTPTAEHNTKSGKIVRDYNWIVRDADGDVVVEATIVMLMSD